MTSPEDFIAEIRRQKETGHKIVAIKMVRHLTGLGLKDAKELVENDLESLKPQDYDRVDPMPESQGCSTSASLILLGLLAWAYGFWL